MVNLVRYVHPRSLKHLAGTLDTLVKGRLWVQILVAMVLGVGVGLLLGPSADLLPKHTARVIGQWLALPGYLFLALVQMVVIPLIFSSVIRGLAASEDPEMLRKLGLRVVVYFLLTTTIAISLGIGTAALVRPGAYIDADLVGRVSGAEVPDTDADIGGLPSLGELPSTIVGILPENPVTAMVETQMLQIVIFAVFIGIALLSMQPRQSKPLLDLLGSLQAVCMKVIGWAMLLAPLAVFGLLAKLTGNVGLDVLFGMGVYVLTVLLGLALLLLFYLVLVSALGRRSPLSFLRAVREVQLLAFSTSSSAAVMPLSIRTAEEDLKVRPSISGFLVPLGATINMDGTALYQGAATMFLAQVFEVDLSVAALVFVVVTAVSASIGAPATPGVGIVILATVLGGVGIPASGVALIIGVDRILDMSRTALNVTGDLTACTVMDRWVGGKLTHEEEARREEELERMREETGEDVVQEELTEA